MASVWSLKTGSSLFQNNDDWLLVITSEWRNMIFMTLQITSIPTVWPIAWLGQQQRNRSPVDSLHSVQRNTFPCRDGITGTLICVSEMDYQYPKPVLISNQSSIGPLTGIFKLKAICFQCTITTSEISLTKKYKLISIRFFCPSNCPWPCQQSRFVAGSCKWTGDEFGKNGMAYFLLTIVIYIFTISCVIGPIARCLIGPIAWCQDCVYIISARRKRIFAYDNSGMRFAYISYNVDIICVTNANNP